MKKEIHHQNTIQSETELKFSAKEKALESEKNQFKNKAAEFERILRKNRKNESTLKEELVKAKNQLSISKQAYDQQLFTLKNENQAMKENFNFQSNDLNNKISQLTRECTEVKSNYETSEEERKTLKALSEKLQEQLEEFKNIKSEREQLELDHQNAEMKIKQLEYEISSFGDWKDLSKASHTRMHNMCDMEKEVERLRNTNKNLHDSLGNKLLLEERVHDLEARLKRFEQSNVDQIGLKVQLEALEKELKDWKKLGVDYAQKNSANNPINLRTYIEKLLHRDLLLMSEKSNVSTEKSNIAGQVGELKNVSFVTKFLWNSLKILKFQQNETSLKQIESLRKSLKSHQSVLAKLQKKLLLITAERDSQRQLLDNYEKDLTSKLKFN